MNLEKLRRKLAGLDRDTRGATMIEYIVIVSLILLVAIGAWRTLGSNVNKKVGDAAKELQ